MFRIGDKVRVTRGYPHEVDNVVAGWDNVWVSPMDQYIGKEGYVVSDHGPIGIEVNFDQTGVNFGFPADALEHV